MAPELRFLLKPRDRHGRVESAPDGVSTLGHVVESLGIPLTEVGALLVDGRTVTPAHRPAAGDRVSVRPVGRPQQVADLRFSLDVHLGALARRMRLVGLDTAYDNDRDDDALIELANAQRRVLLTKDRLLLRRHRLWLGAYVRGDRPDRQLADVLDRFAPALEPWTRCTACNGPLAEVGKGEIAQRLEPGTRRSYEDFGQCQDCGRLYWAGAHHEHLRAIVEAATSAVRARISAPRVADYGRSTATSPHPPGPQRS